MDENNLCQLVSIFDDLCVFDFLEGRLQIMESYRGIDALFADVQMNLGSLKYGNNLEENISYLREHLDSCTPCSEKYNDKYKDLLGIYFANILVPIG